VKGAMRLLVLGIVGLLLLGSVVAEAGSIEAQVLQFKLDHFYFNSGKEALVFPGHHFAIVRGKDTVVSGVIDESYDGVSIGSGKLPKDGKRNFEKYKAVLETAETERLSMLRIGVCAGGSYFEAAAAFDSLLALSSSQNVPSPNRTPLSSSAPTWDSNAQWADEYYYNGDTVLVWASPDTLDLFDKLDRNLIDAVAMVGASRGRDNFKVQTERGPLVVTLVPNLKSDSVKNGLLAKSLACRFDPSRIHTDLTEQCGFMSSFRPMDTSDARAYPHDPARGRELFRQIVPKPTVVRICTSPLLMPIASYFADVLAREQCRTEVVIDSTEEPYDLAIACKEYKTDVAIRHQDYEYSWEVEELRWPFGEGYFRTSDQIGRLATLGGAISAATDTSVRDSLYALGDKLLLQEIGYIPICRPKYSLIVRPGITGICLTKDGQLVVTNPRSLIPSNSMAGQSK
jgi:hypothetical protein